MSFAAAARRTGECFADTEPITWPRGFALPGNAQAGSGPSPSGPGTGPSIDQSPELLRRTAMAIA